MLQPKRAVGVFMFPVLHHFVVASHNFNRDQRRKTGTDLLKENDMKGMEALEKKMLGDRKYIAEKIRKFACIQIDYGHYKNAQELLLRAIKTAPFYKMNYKSLLYLVRSKGKNKQNELKYTELHSEA